jgi:hypothetical protein
LVRCPIGETMNDQLTSFESNTEAARMPRRPATRANQIWSVEIVRWDCPVILAVDVFSMLPLIAYPTYGTAEHVVSKLEEAAQLSGYPAKLWVKSQLLFESRHLEGWATQHRIRVIYKLTTSQRRITTPLVERLRRDCLNDLKSIALSEMAGALRRWRNGLSRG